MFEKYDAYKDSGMDWIGEIPHDWNVVKLKHLLQEPLKYGANESGIEFSEDLPRYIRITDFNDDGKLDEKNKLSLTWKKGKDYLLDDGDILLARSGASVGKSFLFKLENANEKAFCFAGYLIKAKADINKIIPKYLYLYLNSEVFFEWKNLIFNKATIENIGADKYSEFFIILPSLDEQSKILDLLNPFLMNIDQAIAIKEQQIALLNERKQIVIQKAVTQGLDPNVPMKDSDIDGIGKIPKHWETFFNRRLFRENSRPVKGDELPLSLSQKDGVIPSGEMKEKSLSPAHRNNFKLCFPNDLVVNRFKGHLGVFFQSNYIGIVTFHYGVFEPAKNVYTKYFELLYHTEQYKTLYAGASNGMSIGLQNLSNLNFYRIKSIVPPLEEQKMICDYADKVEKEHSNLIQKLEIQIEKLKEYKTTLINDAVTGKIKVA